MINLYLYKYRYRYMTNNIYTSILSNYTVNINISEIDNDLENTLLNILKYKLEGKCSRDGFVKPDSIKIKQISEGCLYSNYVIFMITYTCLIAYPVESQNITCRVKSITKVGIRAEIDDTISPFIIFLARDHHYNIPEFSNIVEEDLIDVRVLGQRFELNDINICIIAEFIEKNKNLKADDEYVIDEPDEEKLIKLKKPIKMKTKM